MTHRWSRRRAVGLVLAGALAAGCSAETWQAIARGIDQGLAPTETSGAEHTTEEDSAAPLPGAISPVDAILRTLKEADSIFNEVNWRRLRADVRTLRGWRVVDREGHASIATIEVAFVRNYRETERWCQPLVYEIFRRRPRRALGCARPGPPWRIVSTLTPQPGQPRARLILAHELWHLKGYWDHTPDQMWPARENGRPAPRRFPRPGD